MYQCILNVPLWNDWSKLTCSQVQCFPVLKARSLKSLSWISATTFEESIQFRQDPKLRRPAPSWRENLVFHGRKLLYFEFTFVFRLVLLFISIFPIHNLKLTRWFILILKRLIKFNVAVATFKNLLNMAALEECLNKTDTEKVD